MLNLPEMGKVRVYSLLRRSLGTTRWLAKTYNVRGVAVPFHTSIQEEILLARQGSIVGYVMQCGGSSACSKDTVVGLVGGTVGDAVIQEGSIQLTLVLGLLDLLNDSMVGNGRHSVGLSGESNLEVVLDHTARLDGVLQDTKVLALELEEGDAIQDLTLNREDGLVALAEAHKLGIDVGGVLYMVDIVQLLGFGSADGEAGPDNAIGVDGRDEQGGLGGLEVEDVVAVGEGAAGQVVEVAALSL